MQRTLAALILATGLSAAPALADGPGTVVELYTSQGCSSCPPADAVLENLTDYADVIPLALHVDYWDYLGWRDDLGSPLFTARQKAYAHRQNASQVFTPQMIVGGTDSVVGSHAMRVMDLVRKHNEAPDPVTLDVSRSGAILSINATASGGPRPAVVQVAQYIPHVTRDIHRGENAGRQVSYVNTVTSWRTVGNWNTGQPLEMTAQADPALPAVVIVQDGINGPILGAYQLD